ncbi:MAG: bifunctional precorrin-2 dehydrogenase/sirohydrochlorin ferrochelatase [Peptococcaceae bacterium]|nr:bifunctional precorrin-2 dehydrogenase/sirohydrochlorin ferrochelatase [Peptococcaceae bacterium]MBQ2013692.1 bifunctional precorrin-2 dehydrogenase/sirohydrochlorin ferrochelatase [Peptococcaceae bacterium]MBQ5652951.1 bifunctional precorrin-2 dehydrogenase/sirohydrochlorin ferrochelatase [Peptococcaceae bacterium]
MTSMYPVTLKLAGKFCTVVGGGSVAVRKVKSLLEQGAEVTVISPVLDEELIAIQEQFVWRNSMYRDGMLKGSFLVIAATDSRDVNHAVYEWCEEHQVLVNVVDSLQESSFTVNAMVQRGDFMLAVSTSGISPAVSKKVREDLELQYGPEYGTMLEILEEAREEALRTIGDASKRRRFLQSVASMELPELLKQETKEEVQKRVKLCLSSYLD